MNFGELRIKTASYLNRDDLASVIPDFIKMAQNRTERENNWKCMENQTTYTSSNDYLSIPDRFKEAKWLKVKDNNRYYDLIKTSSIHALNVYPYYDSNKGRPKLFAASMASNQFSLLPTPDKEYTYDLYYYAYNPELSNDTDTNWWTDNAWELLLYGALVEAEPYLIEDARVALWANFYKDEIDKLRRLESAEEFSGPQAIRNGAVIY